MCITSTFKKFRAEPCSNSTTAAPYIEHNGTTLWDTFAEIVRFGHEKDFCVPEEENKSKEYPWYTPELDVYNKNHFIIYRSEDSNDELVYEENNFPNTIWITKPTEEIIIKTSVFVPLVIWGIFANMSLLYVIMKYRHLRTPTNMVIANMAIADLTSLAIYPWLFLISDFYQNFMFGKLVCKAEGWLEFSLLLVNMINLCTITYDRLTAIVLPQETRLTRRGAKITIIVSWIVSLILSSPLIIFPECVYVPLTETVVKEFNLTVENYSFYKYERQWKNFHEIYCTEDIKFLAIYWHILLVMAVWVPLGIMLICYTAIFIKLDRYEQKVLKREHPLSVCYKTKVAKVVFMVVITFVICRIPFTALIFRRNEWLKENKRDQILGINQILWFVARYLIYLNAALDPLLYGLTNENFRRAFRSTQVTKIFFKTKKKIQTPNNICVNVIQPRGPYKMDNKSDRELILKCPDISETSKDKTNLSSPKTDIKNIISN